MDPNNIPTHPLSDSARKILYNELCQAMIDGLKASLMEFEAAQDSAGFILEKLDPIKTYPELVGFLEELSAKWPSYKPVYFMVKEIETKVSDEHMIGKVLGELKSFNN